MAVSKKSLVTIKIVDVFGNPISKAQYAVKNQRTGGVIAAGITNSAGCIVEISRDKGTVLDVYIKSMFNGMMLKVQSFTMSKDRMLVKIASPKVLLDLQTLQTQGANGQYKRKTHTVRKGETLTSIALQNHTTVRALERLNKIDDPDKINIGQVIKLPVDIPATGSHAHQDKPKPKPSAKPKSTQTTAPKPKTTEPQGAKTAPKPTIADTSVWGTVTGIGGKVVDVVEGKAAELEKKYEEGKKAFGEMVGSMKIPTLGDRSQEGGTPKTNATNLCKTSPQCISSGKSELIREVNIRLAGFGGARPTDEFTSLTEKCIKQFQRDYMGTEQTGKICGGFIAALDKFNSEYPIDQYMGAIACPCNKYGGGAKCNGFGAGRTKQYKVLGVEAPGMHRTTMWILKAAHFYLKMEKELGVKITGISSGYRCIENNAGHNGSHKVRTTVNHMGGAAIDVLISDNKKLDAVRKNIFIKYMNASPIGVRGENQIFLESAAQSATGWIHFDILWYEDLNVKNVKQYATTTEKIINGSLYNLFKKDNDRILGCSGIVKNSTTQSTPNSTNLDKNIKAFLDTIAKSEGTFDHGDNGYNVMVTGKLMKSYADHPFTHNDKALHVKGSLYSTASGRYQIMRVNWYGSKGNPKLGLKYQLGLNDFSPKNQDIAAIALLKRRNAYNLISQGKIKTAFRTTSLNKEWASFPGAGYNQQEHKIEKILKWYQGFGGTVTD